MTAELFPTEIRYSGGAISSQLGLVLTGFAPSIAAAVSTPARHGWPPVCIMVAACCILSAATAAVLHRETSQTSTRQLGTD